MRRLLLRGLFLRPDEFQDVVAPGFAARKKAVDCILVRLEYLEHRGQLRFQHHFDMQRLQVNKR
jgi:hypothetical protein